MTEEDLQEEVEPPDVVKDVLDSPRSAQVAQHNHTPFHRHRPEPGRLHDAARERTPLIVNTPVREHVSRWQTFAKASAYPPVLTHEGQRVDEQWLMEHMPDLEAPRHLGGHNGDVEKGAGLPFSSRAKRAGWYKRLQVRLVLCLLVRSTPVAECANMS